MEPAQRAPALSAVLQRLSPQLAAMGLPAGLHHVACAKILDQIFDAGSCVQFQFRGNDGESEDERDDEREDERDDESNSVPEENEKGHASLFVADAWTKRKYDLVATEGLQPNSTVFLIDHMWTTTFPQSRNQLQTYPTLLPRIASLFELPTSLEEAIQGANAWDDPELINYVWNKMWPMLNSYNVDGPDGYTTWYLMDEVGSAIAYERSPNCRVYPIYVNLQGIQGLESSGGPYGLSLLWPIREISAGEALTRDYLPSSYATDFAAICENFQELPLEKRIELLKATPANPLNPLKLSETITLETMRQLKEIGFFDLPSGQLTADSTTIRIVKARAEEVAAYLADVDRSSAHAGCELLIETPVGWQHINNLLDEPAEQQHVTPLKIYCDRDDYLSASCLQKMAGRFQFVADAAEADILYLIDHVIDVETDKEHEKHNKILTQFWWEGMIVTKNHFIRTMKAAWLKAGHTSSDNHFCWPWIAPTYDLSKPADFAAFIGHFVAIATAERENTSMTELDNMWMLKKHTGRQGIDYPITSNLSCAIRHTDLWPRLACKYITRPCLFNGCKFDLRYYVVVLSLQPLKIFRHQIFIPRASNVSYSLDDFECYQKHFTVMGFLEEKSLLQDIRGVGARKDPLMHEFIAEFDREQASGLQWEAHIQPEIDKVLKNIFECVALVAEDEPAHPSGHALHPNAGWSISSPNACPARAMFGVDIMLDTGSSSIVRDGVPVPQPVVLEVQFAPDCYRTHLTYPQFWDLTLGALFLGSTEGMVPL